jgi:hypothetical protein
MNKREGSFKIFIQQVRASEADYYHATADIDLSLEQGTQNTVGSTLFCFPKSKQIICLLEGWIRKKTVNKCKQMYFIPQMV